MLQGAACRGAKPADFQQAVMDIDFTGVDHESFSASFRFAPGVSINDKNRSFR
jgi:hypothetical protein